MNTWERVGKLVRGGQRRIIRSLNPAARTKDDLSTQDRRFLERYFRAVDRLDLPDHLVELLPRVLVESRQAVGLWPRVDNLRARLESEAEEERYDAEMDTLADAYGWGGQG